MACSTVYKLSPNWVQRSRSFLSSILMLWPAPYISACSASPSAPLSGFRLNLPSIFMCPMAGSMALRRLIIAFMALVTRRWPALRISTTSIFTPLIPLSTITVLGLMLVKMLTCSIVSSKVCPFRGLPGIERMPTTKPSLSVVVTVTFTPNS